MTDLTPGQQTERALRAASLAREIGHLANMLTGLDYRIHMAAARMDFEEMIDGCEQAAQLHVAFAELTRRFQAARMREHSDLAAQVVVSALVADNRMSV